MSSITLMKCWQRREWSTAWVGSALCCQCLHSHKDNSLDGGPFLETFSFGTSNDIIIYKPLVKWKHYICNEWHTMEEYSGHLFHFKLLPFPHAIFQPWAGDFPNWVRGKKVATATHAVYSRKKGNNLKICRDPFNVFTFVVHIFIKCIVSLGSVTTSNMFLNCNLKHVSIKYITA